MTATYIHTRRKLGFTQWVLRALALLYFIALALSVAYLWLRTQDRFITVASFKITRQDSTGLSSGLAQLVMPGLSETGSSDSQTAIGYINSADLLIELEKEFDLLRHYSSPPSDFVFRLAPDAPIEDRLNYYRKRITGHFESQTGLTILTVDTFDPALSFSVASRILQKSEEFINEQNQRVADQQLDFVRAEVERSANHVNEVNEQLLTLQNQHNLINPEEMIQSNLLAIQEMRLERLRTEADLSSILRDSPGSPRIDTIRSRLRSLNELIDIETAKLSGPEQNRLNQILVQFNQLKQKLEFATQLRTGAEMLLEKNRVEAISRSRFFSVVQNPYLPEDVGLPRRPYATVTILCLGMLGFLVLRALTRSVFARA
jgi:capsular polysaccharide transport system permease protein